MVSFVRVTAGSVLWLILISLFLPSKLYFSFIFLAIIQSFFAVGTQLFMNNALNLGNISLFSLVNMTTPLITAILGVSLLKESLSLIQVFGAIIILTSSVILVRKYK